MLKLSEKIKLIEVTQTELDRISALTTPQQALAMLRIPPITAANAESFDKKVLLALDGVQDPGNLGTIIRTADWFGFSTIVCSPDTVDAYNPKVVQATMGSLSRIKLIYTDLTTFLQHYKAPVYGALLDGRSVYETAFAETGILILGNEGNGISSPVQKHITQPVTIPRFGKAESLNVAISAGVFCSEIRKSTVNG